MSPRWPVASRLPALAAAALMLAAASPWALAQPRLLAQRSQTLCQMPRQVPESEALTVLLDSAAAWQRHVGARGNAPVLGRSVRWPQEQVLLHVLPEQPTMGIRVAAVKVQAGPVLVLRVTRPGPGQMAPMALSRPCVWTVVQRSGPRPWRVQVVDAAAGAPALHLAERLAP